MLTIADQYCKYKGLTPFLKTTDDIEKNVSRAKARTERVKNKDNKPINCRQTKETLALHRYSLMLPIQLEYRTIFLQYEKYILWGSLLEQASKKQPGQR